MRAVKKVIRPIPKERVRDIHFLCKNSLYKQLEEKAKKATAGNKSRLLHLMIEEWPYD